MRKRAQRWVRRYWWSLGIAGLVALGVLGSVFAAYYYVLDPQPVATSVAVATDSSPPELISVIPYSRSEVDLVFSEPLAKATYGHVGFSIDDGTRIKAARLQADTTIRLTLARNQVKGRAYAASVEQGVVADTAGNLNLESSMRFAGFGASGGVLTVKHGGGDSRPVSAVAKRQEEAVVVDQLAFTSTGGDSTVSQVRVRSVSTGDNIFADLVEAWLFEDDGDGRFQADGRDRQLHVSVPFQGTAPGAPATFSELHYVVPSGQTRTIWVVFRLGNLAINGRYVGALVRPGDIQLSAGTLADHGRLLSGNGGRTIFIDQNANAFARGRVVDPRTVIVTLADSVDQSVITPSAFTVNNEPVESATLGPDGTTVRLITKRPLDTKTVTVDFSPVGVQPKDVAVMASFAGPTYQSPGDTLPPTVPGSVSASVGTTSPVIASITWSASFDNNVVKGYRVWRATSASGYYRSIATTPAAPFKDTTGIPRQSYYYKVSAFDPTGNESTLSAASAAITATWTPQPHSSYGSGNLCALCHAPHNAATDNGILRQLSAGTGETVLCYQCHDGTGAVSNVKNGATNSFALASGHTLESLVDTTNVDMTNACSDCHGPHQNRAQRAKLWRSTINGNSVTGNNKTWCMACHDSKHSWYKPGEVKYDALIVSPTVNATGYPTVGTYPGSDVATNPAKNAHAIVTEAGQTEAFACKACHDNHRGTAPQDMLLYELRPSTTTSRLSDRQTGAYAQMCLRCHDGSLAGATNIKQHVTANYSDSAAFGGHRVLSPGSTEPTGSPLPCYECHNVHGSGLGNNSNISDARGASLTTTEGATAGQIRQFCLTCHSTSDGQVWSGGAYRSVRTTETVLGLRRDGLSPGPMGEPQNWVKLKAVDGHSNSGADQAKSCYRCHGDRYDAGKNNVHNPGPGESGGSLACGQCHDIYTSMQSGASSHHYMVSDAASSSVISAATLTTSDTRRNCLTCHVDHDIFNPTINLANLTGRSANLRASVATAPNAGDASTYLATDFDPLSGSGVCTSCHRVGIIKNTTNRRTVADRSVAALKITSAAFKASGHNYQSVSATVVSDGKAFKPNCSKCHDDRTTSEFFGTRQVASHDDTRPALLSDFGLSNLAADPREAFCFGCHSRSTDSTSATPSNPFGGPTYTTTAGIKDVYGTQSMDATSVNIKGQFIATGIVSSHPVTATLGPRVDCANCHSVHSAGEPNSVVANPDNTLDNPADGSVIPFYTRWYVESNKSLAARTNRDFCLKCHDGAAPLASANTSTTYVPYDVTVAVDQSGNFNPTRRTNNKDDNASKSHYNTTGQQAATARPIDGTCSDCHDQHGSTLPALLGLPSRASAQNFLGGRFIYSLTGTSTAVSGNNTSVCYACHAIASAGYTTSESRNASGYPMTGRFPGSAVATVAYSAAAHTGNPHKSAATQWPGREGDYPAGDCKNCHDPHGTANPYDQLRTETVAGVEATYTYSPGSLRFCFNCHDGSPSINIKQFFPVSVGGTNPDAYAGHKITSTSPSLPVGAALPCYDCHNSHGSASPYGLQVRNLGAAGQAFDMSTAAGVRAFCFACHTTSDAVGYGRVSAGMETISAGTQFVEGIDRRSLGLKLPPLSIPYVGHANADTKSCYDCHGDNDYSAGGHNVHNPDITAITLDCYGCHGGAEYRSMESSSPARSTTYHHVLGDVGAQADRNFGISSVYPTSTATLRCVSCHTGHEYFDASRGLGGSSLAANLRVSITDPDGASRANSDFIGSGQYGICVSCHNVRLAKDAGNQRSDTTTWSPAVPGVVYNASAHQYSVNATVTSDSSSLKPNCSKCHNSQIASTYITPASGFGVHGADERNILSALGATLTDPSGATHCMRCHSRTADAVGGTKKTVAGRDWYGSAGTTMTVAAENVFDSFNRAGGSSHPVAPTATGSVQCESCHNPHIVTKTSRATRPSNNMTIAAYGTGDQKTAYCMECHAGSPPKYVSTATTYVASTVTMTATLANKKTAEGASHWVANGSIRSTTVAGCVDCHDKHGSKYEKLVGIYTSSTTSPTVAGQPINGNDETACYACHQAAGLGYPTGVATTATVAEWDAWRTLGGYISPTPTTTRTAVMWPGRATYALSPHGSTARTAPTSLNGGPAKDCNTCHDVHGTSANPYDELRLPYQAGNYALCFECHEGSFSATNIVKFYPTAMGGLNNGDNAGHRIKTAGGTYAVGTPLPCWECHLTHGSADGNLDLLSDARWNGLSDLTINGADCREFCFGCHTSEDRYRYSSANSTMIPVPASDTQSLIASLPRSPVSPTANKLILPHLQTGAAHYRYGTESCYECHGKDYTSASSINVHNPSSGVSNGARTCYDCHTAYLEMEDDVNGGRGKTGAAAGNKTMYHHVLGSVSNDGDWAPGAAAYPVDKNDIYCVSCHTDHNNFNGSKHANLRASINSASGVATASSDFATTGDNGVCVSCHTAALSKDRIAQKSDGTTSTPKITGSTYNTSAHQYSVQSYYDSSSTPFGANCSKCHDDSFDYEQDSPLPNRFGTHLSDDRKSVGPLGDSSAADPLGEKNCYRCHSVTADAVGGTKKSQDGRDWYGTSGKVMNAVSQTTFSAFQLTGSTHPVDPNGNGSYVECGNCHNVHVVSGTTPTVDPLNTYTPMVWNTANKTTFCLRCHDANRGPSATTTGTSFVPTSVVMAGPDLPLMDKATQGARGHWTATVDGAIRAGEEQTCVRCHDRHGSQFDKLVGVVTGGGMSINALPVTGNNESVCYACHTAASTNATTTPDRSAAGYIEQGSWLGKKTWELGYNSTEHTGSPHAQTSMLWPGTGGPGVGGDCKNCHDVHGTPNSKDMLRTTNSAGADIYRFDETVYTVCFACHNGSQAGVSNIATYYPVVSGGTSGAPRAGHKFDTGARAGYPLPCYDCHNPHGTGDSAYTLLVNAKTGLSTTVVLGDQANEIRLRSTLATGAYDTALREFCFACHTTSNTTVGWAGSAGYQVVPAGTTFEGISRTDAVAGNLKLSSTAGHASTDSQSCYQCHGGTGANNVHNLGTGMAEHLAISSNYVNATVTGCVGSGNGCHGVTNDLTVVHRVDASCGVGQMTGVLNCHDIDGAGAGTTEYTSVRTSPPNDGRNLDCTDCHSGLYADTYNRAGLNAIYPSGHYSEPTHTAGAVNLSDPVIAPAGGTASATCNNCHSAGSAGTGRGLKTQHQGVRITLGNLDGNLTCADCHGYNATVSQVVTASAFSAGGGVCSACHVAGVLGLVASDLVKHGTTAPSVIGTSTSQAGCISSGAGCHNYGTWDLHVIHKGDGGPSDPTCGGLDGCHDYTKQGVKPASKDCDVCHANYSTNHGGTVTGDEASHTAQSMTTIVDATYNAGGANTCNVCHSAGLSSAHKDTSTTARLDSANPTWPSTAQSSCFDCHNATSPDGSVLTIKTDWWTPQTCDQCHVARGNGKHATYASNHVGSAAAGCTWSSSCHSNSFDLRVLHNNPVTSNASTAGCDSAGCHDSRDEDMNFPATNNKKSCGVGGDCHTGMTHSNHGSAEHNIDVLWTAAGSTMATFSAGGINYGPSLSIGCGGASGFGGASAWGCHYSNLITEHSTIASGGAGRQMNNGGSGCNVCHSGIAGAQGNDAAQSVIASAIAANDLRCETCHNGVEANGTAAGHQSTLTTGAVTAGSTQIGVVRVGGGEFKSWKINTFESSGGHRAFNYLPSWPLTTIAGAIQGTGVGYTLRPTGTLAVPAYDATNYTTNPRTGAPWAQGAVVLCEDCHWYNSAPTGPQGANVPLYVDGLIARPAAGQHWYNTYNTGTTTPAPCNKCHIAVNQSSHRAGHAIPCEGCHVRIPHAWKRPRLLRRNIAKQAGETTGGIDPMPYSSTAITGLQGYAITAAQTSFSDGGACQDNCNYVQGTSYSGGPAAPSTIGPKHPEPAPYWP